MRQIRIAIFLIIVAALLSSYGCRSNSAPETKAVSFASNNSQAQANYDVRELPKPQGFANDFAGALDQATKEKLEKTLMKFKESRGIEFAVVTVKTTGDQSAFDYSLALMRNWGVGSPAHGGLLLLVAMEDKRWHIQISRRIEKVLTNEEVGQFGSVMKPFFLQSKYGEGIEKCVDLFIKELTERNAS
ncbi:MAG TPA: TPM domain-containing protein [Pyrinomonadaceae bacterium]|jgi:uncharacterized protein|nr:TPM domain-containing protein [Pyrinomonadaceae bacterium]